MTGSSPRTTAIRRHASYRLVTGLQERVFLDPARGRFIRVPYQREDRPQTNNLTQADGDWEQLRCCYPLNDKAAEPQAWKVRTHDRLRICKDEGHWLDVECIVDIKTVKAHELPVTTPERALTLRAWSSHVASRPLNRNTFVETIIAWPHTKEADQSVRHMDEAGVLTAEELESILDQRLERRRLSWFPDFGSRHHRTRVINGTVRAAHHQGQCLGRPCWIHWPSDHALRDWPVHYWNTTRSPERVCQHWSSHPDPDDLAWRRLARLPITHHECVCGCCR